MTGAIPDAEVRRAALDPQCSFTVQAPAGSGKTELLTQRFLRLLALVDEPEEVVAITFTRKAAAEMRGRIVEALASASAGLPPDTEHQRLTQGLATDVLRRDTAREWDLLRFPGRLRVVTIDALCASITRQMPVLSRFGTQPRTADRPLPLYRKAARETLGVLESDLHWSEHLERLVRHRGNDLLNLETLLTQMLARRDQWLRHVGAARTQEDRRARMEAALRELVGQSLESLCRSMPGDVEQECLALLRYAAENSDPDGDSPIRACARLTAFPSADPDNLDQWLALRRLLLTASGEWRKSVSAREGFPPPSAAKDTGERSRRQEMKRRFAELLADMSQRPGLLDQLKALDSLPCPAYGERRWQIVEALIEVLTLAYAQLRLVFQEAGQVDFSEISHAAIDALGQTDAPSDLALRLDYGIRHLLVDEFQDTSVSQYELLLGLSAGWSPGDGRTVFLVGDPMQSIYRFREAEVGVFLRVRRHGLGDLPLKPLQLVTNFRSCKGVVEWVNRSFARIMPEREDVATGAVPHAAAVAVRRDPGGGGVRCHPLLTADPKKEAECVVALVKQALDSDADGNVAVLVRARSHVAATAMGLRAAGVAFQAVEIEPLAARPAITDLRALTRALLHPADRLAWLSVLRAPWCGLTLADLGALVESRSRSTVWPLLKDFSSCPSLSDDARQRLSFLGAVMAEALAERRRWPLARLVERTWMALGGPATLSAPSDFADVEAFLARLASLDEGGDLADFDALDEEIAQLYAAPEAGAAVRVQVMTIHKAKGLEFDTVILPGLGRRPPAPESQLLTWLEIPRERAQATDLLLAPIRGAQETHDPIYRYIAKLNQRKDGLETVRLLYVAVTRAKRSLHLVGHALLRQNESEPRPETGSLLSYLWPVLASDYSAISAPPAAEESQPQPREREAAVLRRLSPQRRRVSLPPPLETAGTLLSTENPAPEERLEFDWAGDTARHVGTVVHRMLQRVLREGLSEWDPGRIEGERHVYRRLLLVRGVSRSELDDAVDRVESALRGALTGERGRWLLSADHRDCRSEYPLAGVIDGRLVSVTLDLTFVDSGGVRWVVDYKTGAHEGGDLGEFLDREQARYRRQLETYGRLMARIEARPIRLGLYFPRLDGWREWPFAAGGE